MAHALSITDGTTTVSLSTTNFMMLQYVPNAPVQRNGVYDNVTDSIELNAYGANVAAAQTAIQSVETLLTTAARSQRTQTGAKVYITLTLDGGSAYRSEIVSGTVSLGLDSLRAWGGADISCTLIIERVPHWDGAEVTLFSNQSITNADGSNSYYTSAAVTGTQPTPCKIQVKNTGLSDVFRHVHMGVNAFNAPATFDGTLGSKTLTITAPAAYADDLAAWAPSSAESIAMNGDYFRFVAAFSSAGSTPGVSYRMELTAGSTVVAHTNQLIATTSNFYVMDFGAMYTPPIVGGVAASQSTFSINAYSAATSGSDSLIFVQMFPADNYRHLYNPYTMSANDTMVDDGIEGNAYQARAADSTNVQTVQAHGSPLMLYPGQAHRVSLLTENTSYDATLTQSITVSYRPRRLTI